MKRVLCLVLSFLLMICVLSGCSEDSSSSNKHKDNDNGKESDTQTVWLICEMKVVDEEEGEGGVIEERDIISYDKNGNMISYTGYNKLGEVSYNKEYKYDSNNCRIEEIAYYKGNLGSNTQYKYDRYNNVIEEKCQDYKDGSERCYTYEYEYDSNDRVTQATKFYSTDKTDFIRYNYKYDQNGNIIEIMEVGRAGNINYEQYVYEYNDSGVLCKRTERTVYTDGNVTEFEQFYDEYGYFVKENTPVGKVYTYTNTYDQNNNLVRFREDGDHKYMEYSYTKVTVSADRAKLLIKQQKESMSDELYYRGFYNW